jgi:hypothetical protein
MRIILQVVNKVSNALAAALKHPDCCSVTYRRLASLWKPHIPPDCSTCAHRLLEVWINVETFPCIGVCYLPIVMFHLQFLSLLHWLLDFDVPLLLNCRFSGTTTGRNCLMGIVTGHSTTLGSWFWIFCIAMRRTPASMSAAPSTKSVRTRLKLPSDVSRKQISFWTLSCQG